MNNSFLLESVDFDFSFNLVGEEEIVYHAKLMKKNEDFCIYILFDKNNTFDDISHKCRRWNDEIPYFKFGEYIKVESINTEKRDIVLDFTKTQLIRMKIEVSNNQQSFYFAINSYRYSYNCMDTESKAIFYLTNASKKLQKEFRLESYNTETSEFISIPYYLRLCGFKCKIIANKESSNYPIILQWNNFSIIEEVTNKCYQLLGVISFYYSTFVEVGLSIIQNANIITIEYQQPYYNLQENLYHSTDIAYLNISSKNSVEQRYGLENLLRAIKLADKRSNVKDNNLLYTTIRDYVRAQFVDENSKFLILYSILETYCSEKIGGKKFSDYKKMQKKFDSLYYEFSKDIELTLEEEECEPINSEKPNGATWNLLQKKWHSLKQSLIERPMKNHISKITQLFEKYNIDLEKINKKIADANLKNIKTITQLRNRMVHDRTIDNTHLLPMIQINTELSFTVCIIILKELGVKNISFRECFSSLSIFKK